MAFPPVPELLTTFMPATFTVRTCRRVSFSITNVTGANYSEPAGQGVVEVDEEHGSDVVTARVYVQFQANGPLGVPQPGTVTIEATTIDDDGYDTASPGGTHVLGSWTINLTATPVERPRAAVGLVLDRSGSMWAGAGAAGSRYDLLKESLAVVRDIMRPIDGIGLVTFDDVTATLNQITEMGAAVLPSPPGSGREALDNAIASPDLVPRNLTGIGQGMIDGAAVLDNERLTAGTPYQRFALCVMTDGNENSSPLVADPAVTAAIAPYADAIYAIGLGQPGGVSDAVLTAISNYMLITGDITAAERRFRLTKYFLQILAGITRAAIVVDPQGDLHVGSEHRIPFVLSDHDVQVDVVALSPLAPLLELSLEAPDGTVIDAGFGAPTVEYHEHLDDAFYRLTLPLDPAIPRAGRWTAVLRLTKESLAKHADDRPDWLDRIRHLSRAGTLPYSLIVQSYGDLELEVGLKQSLCLAGDEVGLFGSLAAYGQPYLDPAVITALVTDPKGIDIRMQLAGTGAGRFEGSFVAAQPGLHVVRFLATGGRGRQGRFQREETRTVTAYRGEIPKGEGRPGDDKMPDNRAAGTVRSLMVGPDDSRGELEDFGLTEQPAIDPSRSRPVVPAEHDHDHDHDQGHDHENMVFSLFKRTADGGIVEIPAQDIERDTSGYDEHGHDQGQGPERPAPPEHGEHEHPHH